VRVGLVGVLGLAVAFSFCLGMRRWVRRWYVRMIVLMFLLFGWEFIQHCAAFLMT
jgi:hypothetical protein